MHAAAIVRNGFAYIIIELASNRKSTLAKQMVANPSESAFLLVGDRIVRLFRGNGGCFLSAIPVFMLIKWPLIFGWEV